MSHHEIEPVTTAKSANQELNYDWDVLLSDIQAQGVEEAFHGTVNGEQYRVDRIQDHRNIYMVHDTKDAYVYAVWSANAHEELDQEELESLVAEHFEEQARNAAAADDLYHERIGRYEQALTETREHLEKLAPVGPIEETIRLAGLAYAQETALEAAKTAHRRARSSTDNLDAGAEEITVTLTPGQADAFSDFLNAVDGHPFDEAFPILSILDSKIAMAETRALRIVYETPQPFSTYTKDKIAAARKQQPLRQNND